MSGSGARAVGIALRDESAILGVPFDLYHPVYDVDVFFRIPVFNNVSEFDRFRTEPVR